MTLVSAQWFSTATQAGDPITDNLASTGASWNDLNNDGFPDLLVSGFDVAQNNRIYLNNQDDTYSTLTETPFTQTPGLWGSVVGLLGDYDNDGDQDVMVCNYRDNDFQPLPLYLLVNQGAPDYSLEPNTTFTTPLGSYDSGSWLDYDHDGDLDFHAGAANGSTDRFYRNEEGTFVELDTLSFLKFRNGFITAINWVDLDEDGDLDLYVANYTAPNANTFHKSMLVETGDPNYFVQAEITGLTGEAGANIGFNWIDYDNDGDLDLYLNHFNDQDRFFRNEGELVFTEILDQPMLDVVDYTNFNVWADYDNDGDLDLALAHQENTSKGRIYQNDSGNFTLLSDDDAGDFATSSIANAQSAGTADFDLDGDMDLFVVNTSSASVGAANFLFKNEIGTLNNWFKIKLKGVESNRNGFGSKIYVTAVLNADTIRQMRYVSGGTGSHAFQNSQIQHFGLADASEIISVEVHWLSGIVDVCTDLAVNQLMEVEEGECLLSGLGDPPSTIAGLEKLTLYPNPGNDWLTCSFVLQKARRLHWSVTDINGALRLSGVSDFQQGTHHLPIQTKELPTGHYTIEFRAEGNLIRQAWMKID